MVMNAEDIIRSANLRPTKARLAVLTTIAEANSALSHPEIIERLSTQKEFDRVTIYRVLDWLTEHRLIHKISGENRAWKFQLSLTQYSPSKGSTGLNLLASGHHQHAHLHCSVCGKVTCIHELEPNFSAETLKKYQVSKIEINIKGICADCST